MSAILHDWKCNGCGATWHGNGLFCPGCHCENIQVVGERSSQLDADQVYKLRLIAILNDAGFLELMNNDELPDIEEARIRAISAKHTQEQRKQIAEEMIELRQELKKSREQEERLHESLADKNQTFVKMLNDLEGLVIPKDPTGWDYPAQVVRHVTDEITKLRAQVEHLRESLAELVEQVDRSMHGETSLHTWECPAPDHGKCSCNAEATMDAARKVLEEAK